MKIERVAVWNVQVSGLFPNSKYPQHRQNIGFTVVCETLARAVEMVTGFCASEAAEDIQVHQAMRRGYTDHILLDLEDRNITHYWVETHRAAMDQAILVTVPESDEAGS